MFHQFCAYVILCTLLVAVNDKAAYGIPNNEFVKIIICDVRTYVVCDSARMPRIYYVSNIYRTAHVIQFKRKKKVNVTQVR